MYNSFGLFFLAQVQHGGGGWSANVFLPCVWIGLLIFIEEREKAMCQLRVDCKSVTEKTTVVLIVRKPTKIPCKPRFDRLSDRQTQQSVKSADLEIRGGDFWRLGIALRICPLLTYRRSLTAFFILLCMIYYYWIQLMSKHCNT